MHEQSETIQLPDGRWINVYGRNTSKAGMQLPDTEAYFSLEDAVNAAKTRSATSNPKMNNFMDPKFQGLMTLASGLLSAGGWQNTPTTLGQALGSSGLQALQAMQKAQMQKLLMEDTLQLRHVRAAQEQKLRAEMQAAEQEKLQFGQFQGLVSGLNQQDFSGVPSPTAQVPFRQQMEQNMLGPFAPQPSRNWAQNFATPEQAPQEAAFQNQLSTSGRAAAPTVEGVSPNQPWDVLNDQADYLEKNSSFITDDKVQAKAQAFIKSIRDRADRLENRGKGSALPSVPGVFDVNGKPYELIPDGKGGIKRNWLTTQQVQEKLEASRRDPVLQQKIAALIESGVPEKYAKGIAAGRYEVSVNPVSGERQVIDVYTGKPVHKDVIPAGEPVTETAVPKDIKASRGTGASGFFGNIANKVKDALGLPMGQPKVQEAINALDNLNVQTTSLLQAAVPGRPSVALMNRLAKLTVDPASLLQADQAAQARLKQTRDMLNVEINRMERDILGKAQLFKPEQVTETRLNHSQLKQLLREYDQILKSFEPEVRGLKQQDEGTRSPLIFEDVSKEERYQQWKKSQDMK